MVARDAGMPLAAPCCETLGAEGLVVPPLLLLVVLVEVVLLEARPAAMAALRALNSSKVPPLLAIGGAGGPIPSPPVALTFSVMDWIRKGRARRTRLPAALLQSHIRSEMACWACDRQ